MISLLVLLLAVPAVLAQLQNTTIHPGADASKCLDVRADVLADGTPVQIYDCNGTPAQTWTIAPGETKVQLTGTNFCLDAGSTPGNGIGLKIWQCYAGLAAQQWYLTDDNRIALENQGLCLDLTNGDTTDGTQVQTWQCTANDYNQVWNPVPVVRIVQLHPNGDNDKCLDVRGGDFADGTPVQIYDCNGTPAQTFILVPGPTSIQVNGTNFCLDAGNVPADGTGVKIWTCYPDLPAQRWEFIGNGLIALQYTTFCLDLTNGILTDGNQVQSWDCTPSDSNQIWTLY